jgi:hypothetical protein
MHIAAARVRQSICYSELPGLAVLLYCPTPASRCRILSDNHRPDSKFERVTLQISANKLSESGTWQSHSLHQSPAARTAIAHSAHPNKTTTLLQRRSRGTPQHQFRWCNVDHQHHWRPPTSALGHAPHTPAQSSQEKRMTTPLMTQEEWQDAHNMNNHASAAQEWAATQLKAQTSTNRYTCEEKARIRRRPAGVTRRANIIQSPE